MPSETRLIRETVTFLNGPYTFKAGSETAGNIYVKRHSATSTGAVLLVQDETEATVAFITPVTGAALMGIGQIYDITLLKAYWDSGISGVGWALVSQTASNVVLWVAGASGQSGPLLRISTTATNDDPTFEVYQAKTTTTDATVTTLQTIPITASQTYMLEARIKARRTGGTAGTADDGAGYIRRCMVTTKAGTVTINAVQDGFTQEDQAGWDATLTVSGANVLVRVTGAVNNNISWDTTTFLEPLGT